MFQGIEGLFNAFGGFQNHNNGIPTNQDSQKNTPPASNQAIQSLPMVCCNYTYIVFEINYIVL